MSISPSFLQYFSQPQHSVIAPTSLATQWEEEIKRLTPSLKVLLHTGANRTNGTYLLNQKNFSVTYQWTDPEALSRYHVVITSYGTVASEHNDSPKKKKVLNALFKVKWWRIALGTCRRHANFASSNFVP